MTLRGETELCDEEYYDACVMTRSGMMKTHGVADDYCT